jgi:hypothetical protein
MSNCVELGGGKALRVAPLAPGLVAQLGPAPAQNRVGGVAGGAEVMPCKKPLQLLLFEYAYREHQRHDDHHQGRGYRAAEGNHLGAHPGRAGH